MRFIAGDDERRKDAIDYISKLPGHGIWQIDISKYVKNRSNSQNRLYWQWLEEISDYMGNTSDELHNIFRAKFLGFVEKEVKFRNNEGMVVREIWKELPTTTELSVSEFSEYLLKVEQTVLTAFPDFSFQYPDDYKYAITADKEEKAK